jgi:DMSO/TMAO reductase YedYZ molybdopterin-dependent catalytic subunit
VVPDVEWTIELTGSGLEQPTVFSYRQLAEMEMVLLENVLRQMTHFPDDRSSWRGPSLDALLSQGKIKPGAMKFLLEGADGYRIEAAREDLTSAIVALQNGEGQWLTEVGKRRPVLLVVPERPGNYWVWNLRRITVEPSAESGRAP